MNDREREGEKSGEERVKGKVRERKKRQLKGKRIRVKNFSQERMQMSFLCYSQKVAKKD